MQMTNNALSLLIIIMLSSFSLSTEVSKEDQTKKFYDKINDNNHGYCIVRFTSKMEEAESLMKDIKEKTKMITDDSTVTVEEKDISDIDQIKEEAKKAEQEAKLQEENFKKITKGKEEDRGLNQLENEKAPDSNKEKQEEKPEVKKEKPEVKEEKPEVEEENKNPEKSPETTKGDVKPLAMQVKEQIQDEKPGSHYYVAILCYVPDKRLYIKYKYNGSCQTNDDKFKVIYKEMKTDNYSMEPNAFKLSETDSFMYSYLQSMSGEGNNHVFFESKTCKLTVSSAIILKALIVIKMLIY